MDRQAEYLKKLNQDVSEIKTDMKNMESRLGDKIDTKLEEFRNEMRHLDNQRVEDMREIRNSLESTNKHVQNMSMAVIIGIASMVIAVIIGLAGLFYTINSNQQNISDQLQQQNLQIQQIKLQTQQSNSK